MCKNIAPHQKALSRPYNMLFEVSIRALNADLYI